MRGAYMKQETSTLVQYNLRARKRRKFSRWSFALQADSDLKPWPMLIFTDMLKERESLLFVPACETLNVAPSSDLDPYKVVHRDGYAVVKFPSIFQSYAVASVRTKRRRAKIFFEILELLGIEVEDATAIVVDHCLAKCKDLPSTLAKFMSPVLNNPTHAAALIASERFTERQVQFMRSFFNCLPPVKKIRLAKWDFISDILAMFLLMQSDTVWKRLPSKRVSVNSEVARDIISIRFSVPELLTFYILQLKKCGRWPTPPRLNWIPENALEDTVVVLLSIDSGTGTLKLMGRFVTDRSGQSTADVLLLAQSPIISERFENIDKVFGSCASEMKKIKNEGLDVAGKIVRVLFLFVGDFKVIYSVSGGFGARSKYPCPWCCCLRQKMDWQKHDLQSTDLQARPEIMDLRSRPHLERWQKSNTFNLFHIERGGHQCWENGHQVLSRTTIVPPSLHIRLGIVNKVLSALDAVVVTWHEKMEWTKTDKGLVSPAMKLLAKSLLSVGVRRERYYSGQLSGSPCSLLMSRMDRFCDLFFFESAEHWGSVVECLPGTLSLNENLRALAILYSGDEQQSNMGINFFLQSQQRWSDSMLTKWDSLCEKFGSALKKAIWRPERCPKATFQNDPWRQPMLMPKLHTLLSHIGPFVRQYGYFGKFSEESFEHFQKVSKKNRAVHSGNKTTGAQILDDMY
eukprot:IDg1160t1